MEEYTYACMYGYQHPIYEKYRKQTSKIRWLKIKLDIIEFFAKYVYDYANLLIYLFWKQIFIHQERECVHTQNVLSPIILNIVRIHIVIYSFRKTLQSEDSCPKRVEGKIIALVYIQTISLCMLHGKRVSLCMHLPKFATFILYNLI